MELQSTNNYPADPWHLTSQNQGAGLTVDSNAVAAEIGVAGNAEEAGVAGTEHEDYYHSYPVIERYADGALRANSGQVILATAATADTKGLKVSFSEIPAAHAMDTADAVTYQWTAPLYTKAAGDVGEIEPAYRTIAGYVWKDNDYHDGFYTYRLSAQATDPGYPDPEETGNYADRSKLKLEKPEEGRIGTNLFLRQWYFDTEANNGAGEWKPIKIGRAHV